MAAPVRLELRHASGVTPILIGRGVADEGLAELAGRLAGGRLFTISTARVMALHGEVLELLRARGIEPECLVAPEGEEAKRLDLAGELWSSMLRSGGKRDSAVLAFGGGSVGDLSGFVAGAFLRGIRWFQLPTTLLAQADAAIGGKSAVDLPEAKNSVGLFHHPELVICDAALLATLPPRELRSGLFEIVKVAALFDPPLLDAIGAQLEPLLAGDAEALAPIVAEAVRLKVEIVVEDPEDRGRRALLNFGHTLGHAIESALDYQGLTHGEAVAFGMLFALRLARRRGLEADATEHVTALIGRIGLPPLPPLEPERLVETIARDKKARESGLGWILPLGLGQGAESIAVPAAELDRELRRFLQSQS
jgi:3-dehydroquinate synthase